MVQSYVPPISDSEIRAKTKKAKYGDMDICFVCRYTIIITG